MSEAKQKPVCRVFIASQNVRGRPYYSVCMQADNGATMTIGVGLSIKDAAEEVAEWQQFFDCCQGKPMTLSTSAALSISKD